MNRKKLLIFSITGIILTTILLLGVTFGYFNVKVIGNENAKSLTFKNNPLTITYSNNTSSITSSSSSFTPGDSITKTFSITNPTSETLNISIKLSFLHLVVADNRLEMGRERSQYG